MSCCGDSTEVKPLTVNGRQVSAPAHGKEFDGPVKNRGCRDVLCLILFIAFCIAGLIYIIVAFYKSDLNRMIHGWDSEGNVCGRFNDPGVDHTNKQFNDVVAAECKSSCPASSVAFGFRCFPKIQTEATQKYGGEFLQKFASSVENTWETILVLCLIGLALSIVVILLLRFFAAIIVWITVGVIAIGSVAATITLWVFYSNAKNKPAPSDTEVNGFLAGAIAATIITVIILLLLIWMRNRIRLVVQLFFEAGKAIQSMPLLLLQPVWTLMVQILVIAVWILGAIAIQSTGTMRRESGVAWVEMEKTMSGMRIYHLFGFFWVSQFVIACQSVVVAGAVAFWYFSRNKSKLGTPILTSIGWLIRYHLGSVAFGSLIIAIIKMIRVLVKFIENKMKSDSSVVKGICCCFQCCLYCFEKFMKFLNRNAYIEIAIHGCDFCTAAKKAFNIIVNNALRITAINYIGDFVFFLMKIMVVGLIVFFGYLMLEKTQTPLSMAPPLIVAAVITYLIISCFLAVYEMTIDTVFLCFCEDCEMNDGIEKPYFMSRGLMKFVENSKKAMEVYDLRKKEEKQIERPKGIHNIQIPPNQYPPSPAASVMPPVDENRTGITPLHPGYPPVSTPPSPSTFMPPPQN